MAMKLFHFYVDSDNQQAQGPYTLLLPVVQNSKGFGFFYFYLDKMVEITSVGDGGGKSIRSYFENSKDAINNYNNGLGRWGKNKIQELNRPEYIRETIKNIFKEDFVESTLRMWK
jgi:hypothetical protein